MSTADWNTASDYLVSNEVGSWAENDGRRVAVVDMVSGRYLLTDENGFFVRVVDEVWRAVEFLKNGKVF